MAALVAAIHVFRAALQQAGRGRPEQVRPWRLRAFRSGAAPLYRPSIWREVMSDMRLVVAGAGGRMGRTVIRAIAETDGVVLAGAVEGPGSAVIGRDAGELAGIGRNGITVSAKAAALLADSDGLVDFTIPDAT